MPKISIILPIYNVESYLEEAFQSLLSQTLTDIEIIAVNDGSTDNSQKIIEYYAAKDKRIITLQQENKGQSVARNNALKKASGDYIYMMDSDDVINTPEAMQICYDYAERNKADFIFFDGNCIQEECTKKLPWNYQRTYLFEENIPYEGDKLLGKMLDKRKYNCVVWLLFIRRNFLNDIRLSFYPGIIHEDELFTTILILQSKAIFCLKQSLVNHRVRFSSTMGKHFSKRNINCYLTVIDELLKYQNSDITRYYTKYTLSKIFYTGHLIPLRDKFRVFWRAVKSGYLKYIGWKSSIVFWIK